MKVKTSVTLSADLVEEVDRRTREDQSRSEFIEDAVRAFVKQLQRAERDARDIEIINRNADRLNKEMEEILSFQVIP